MFDKETYLDHIGHRGAAPADLATLRDIHHRHQTRFHYDNGYIRTTDFVEFDPDTVFGTIVLKGRGGICTDLNLLFHRLLTELGYDVALLSASMQLAGGQWGPDVEHMVMVVALDGQDWLVDVGNGGISIAEPVPLSGETVTQHGVDFRVTRQGGHHRLEYRTRQKPWRNAYRFTTQPRDPGDWRVLAELIAAQPEERFVRRRRRGTANGQVVQIANILLAIEDGVERPRPIRTEQELREIDATYFQPAPTR
ncbi:amide synthase [Actinoplanes teichomyceticus]|uniref:Amide synthase n=1 Tax=Actinoplanes teichomyceticus TaxID=1867 RepID=A0A561WBG8_ACTTI|nr:amide synthase [Actinoplanes teichomyceticus]GIF15029.1 proansamycin X synthase [Actinoplanes teichomyceticus]